MEKKFLLLDRLLFHLIKTGRGKRQANCTLNKSQTHRLYI